MGIIHYTNSSPENIYGEGFYRNTPILKLPTLMWHKSNNSSIGLVLSGDNVQKRLTKLDLVYYDLVDNNKNIVGKIFNEMKIFVIEDQDLLFALSFKSNRNWTLPELSVSIGAEIANCSNLPTTIYVPTTTAYVPTTTNYVPTTTVSTPISVGYFSLQNASLKGLYGATFIGNNVSSNALPLLTCGTASIEINPTDFGTGTLIVECNGNLGIGSPTITVRDSNGVISSQPYTGGSSTHTFYTFTNFYIDGVKPVLDNIYIIFDGDETCV